MKLNRPSEKGCRLVPCNTILCSSYLDFTITEPGVQRPPIVNTSNKSNSTMAARDLIILIVIVALTMMAVTGYILSASGHYVKTTLNGTVVEQPATSVEHAGQSLLSTLMTVIAFMVGAGIVVIGLMIRFKS
jgi:hypothetical protein